MTKTSLITIFTLAMLALLSMAACGATTPEREAIRTTRVQVIKEAEVMKEAVTAVAVDQSFGSPPLSTLAPAVPRVGNSAPPGADYIAQAAQQQRIIVRTVNMDVVVMNISSSLDSISALATNLGGWVVSSRLSPPTDGFISIRVPAESVDQAIDELRTLAEEVKSENSTSRDVTEEYVDLQARLRNLQATEQALLALMERTAKVEELLEVQRELTRVQEEIERLQGRINLIEQTSAFSLIHVNLELVPTMMEVDSGPDQTISTREAARFRATFFPPEDIDHFEYQWDFGDGSPIVGGNRTAPTLDGTGRTTATVSHVYRDEQDSPFIVTLTINGFGETGVTEGEDTLIVTVTELPSITGFAGADISVEEGEEISFSGSFTRPKGVTDLTYSWDFGDGSNGASGALPGTGTSATATYLYPDHRPLPFTVTFTVTGTAETGTVEGIDTLRVFVTEKTPWVIGEWSPGDTARGAVRGLSQFGSWIWTALVWLAIFSPIWVTAGALTLYGRRRRSRNKA